jgi:hypothetical protein
MSKYCKRRMRRNKLDYRKNSNKWRRTKERRRSKITFVMKRRHKFQVCGSIG